MLYFEAAVLIGFVLMFPMLGVWFVLSKKLFNILRDRHPAEWEELGRISPSNSTPKNNIAYLLFLWRRKYLGIDDAQVVRLCSRLRVLGSVYFAFFFLFVLAVFAGMILAKMGHGPELF